MQNLLRTSDLSTEDVKTLLDLADLLKKDPYHHRTLLQNDTVVLYFDKPSTRTRISFETAVARLGGVPIGVGTQELQLGRGETVEDTSTVMGRYARAITVRTYSDETLAQFAAASTVPVINALTDLHHPCQSLADLMTLREKKGALDAVKLAYVGDGNNVCHSLIEAAALTGMSLKVATPVGYKPNANILEAAQSTAHATGASILWTESPGEAVAGADAVYTDAWVSMGDPEDERENRLRTFLPYQVTSELMSKAAEDAIFMHCLPDHRGEEVTAEVVDGPCSVVFDQAENRLHTAVAILSALVQKKLIGSQSSHT